MRGRSWLASFACLLIIFALAIDPFTQQILAFPTRSIGIQDTNNTLSWLPYTQEAVLLDGISSDNLWRASLGGLYELSPQPTYQCKSGNCSWSPFASLGYCSTCTDVTDTAKSECLQFDNKSNSNGHGCRIINYTMSDESYLIIQNGSANWFGGIEPDYVYTAIKAHMYEASPGWIGPGLLNVDMARLRGNGSRAYFSDGACDNDVLKFGWEIMTCTVSYCAKVYEDVRSNNGALLRTRPRDVTLVTNIVSGDFARLYCNSYKPADPSELPVGSNITYFAFGSFESVYPTSVFDFMEFDQNYTKLDESMFMSTAAYDCPEQVAEDLMVNEDLPGTIDRIANRMTDHLRVHSAPRKFSGTMYVQETFVEVEWWWFALPVALVLSSMVFLIASIVMSKRREPGSLAMWKSSCLPLLVHGLDDGWTVEEENEWASRKGCRSAVESTLDDVVVRLRVNQEERLRSIRE